MAADVAPDIADLCCWVLSDGKPGMENQCRGLAEALGCDPVVKRIAVRPPWSRLPPQLWWRPLAAIGPEGDQISPPWPDLLVATGRQTVAPAAAIRRLACGRTFAVQIQDPTISPRHFDLVVVPQHDRLRGDNVTTTLGALHRVTPARLAAEAPRFAGLLDSLPRPLVAVLVGGSNGAYRLTAALARELGERLAALARRGAGLAITPSRRTGADNEAALKAGLGDAPAFVWDGSGENPYFGLLAHADTILVTGDSVSMVSEACSTGKPVYVIPLHGRSRKFDRFHAELERRGITRRFAGTLENWRYPPLDDTARVAGEIRHRLASRLRASGAARGIDLSGRPQ